MYEDYLTNFYGYPKNLNYQNTYDFSFENTPYNYYGYNAGYSPFNRDSDTNIDLEELYPEIYKIIYPMIKKVCSKLVGPITRDVFEDMVDEVTKNIENNETIVLNINNDVNNLNNVNSASNRGATTKKEEENRQSNRHGLVGDLVRILLIRELIRRPGCQGHNCRPGPGVPPHLRPPFPRYEY